LQAKGGTRNETVKDIHFRIAYIGLCVFCRQLVFPGVANGRGNGIYAVDDERLGYYSRKSHAGESIVE
jgi:hypothetical protein